MAVISSEPIEQATELLQNLKLKDQAQKQDQQQPSTAESSDQQQPQQPSTAESSDDSVQDGNVSDGSFDVVVDDKGADQQQPAAVASKSTVLPQASAATQQAHGFDHSAFQRPNVGFVSPPPYPPAAESCIFSPVPYHFSGPPAPGLPYIPSPPPRDAFRGDSSSLSPQPMPSFVSYPPMMVAGEHGFYPSIPPCISPPIPVLRAGQTPLYSMQMDAFGFGFGYGYPASRPGWNDSKAFKQQQKMATTNFRPGKVPWQRPAFTGPVSLGRDPRSFGYGYNRGKEPHCHNAVYVDVMNEQVRGPRAGKTCGKSGNGSQAVTSLAKEQYNRPDFETSHEDAKFFVIKSYSEDDVHKSIKYNVWASTPKGNRRLDAAYKEAQQRNAGKEGSCPVFLFFSVNASGQFCGVAEMCGPVDFVKSMEFWQQEKKWNGFFPVKWHFIKDIPNRQFRHITLENNDNDPVTNSRDTQEVMVKQGCEMLAIFKRYCSKTSLMDDFHYYDNRQKAMQERRSKPQNPDTDGAVKAAAAPPPTESSRFEASESTTATTREQ